MLELSVLSLCMTYDVAQYVCLFTSSTVLQFCYYRMFHSDRNLEILEGNGDSNIFKLTPVFSYVESGCQLRYFQWKSVNRILGLNLDNIFYQIYNPEKPHHITFKHIG